MKKFNSINEVLDFAIKQEIESNIFYLELADFVEQPEMAKVLTDLAAQELRHKAYLESVKASKTGLDEQEVGNLNITEKVKDIEIDAKMDYVDMLIVGMKKEEASRKLYTDLASIAQNQQVRDIFLKLAQQEAGHKLRFELEYDLMTF
jgi:rubrerythrin